jgi:diguanylate cyclase (GGDEF)-like protein
VVAVGGLVAIVLALSGFTLWSSQANAASTRQATAASALSDHYFDARSAVSLQRLSEVEYRLEPSPGVRATYNADSTDLIAALALVSRDGTASDKVIVQQVLASHARYVAADNRLFAAVDRRDYVAAEQIDAQDANPLVTQIRATLDTAAEEHLQRTLTALANLRRLQTFTATATPWAFGVGLTLVLLFAFVLRLVRRQLNIEQQLARHDSLHDRLTGLPNRTLLANRFEAALRSGRPGSAKSGLLLMGLDRFKDINDGLGYQFGDRVLTLIGPRLAGVLRREDTVARLGGDEFAILLPEVSCLATAMLVAEKVRHALAEPFTINDLDLDIEASIGVVVSGEHGDDANTLLQHAGLAMYVAKKQNVGMFAYDAQADDNSSEKLALLSDMRRALDRSELTLHYQPKVSLSTGDVCGAEALIRWYHPRRGLISPDDFIPLAEKTGLIGPLTLHVLDAALAQAHRWAAAGHRIPVAVNLSARNLLDEHLPDTISRMLEEHAVAPELLELEVTETAITTEPKRAAASLGDS